MSDPAKIAKMAADAATALARLGRARVLMVGAEALIAESRALLDEILCEGAAPGGVLVVRDNLANTQELLATLCTSLGASKKQMQEGPR